MINWQASTLLFWYFATMIALMYLVCTKMRDRQELEVLRFLMRKRIDDCEELCKANPWKSECMVASLKSEWDTLRVIIGEEGLSSSERITIVKKLEHKDK
jgi:hypothetical protein